ncbi:MAG: peptidoglycan bridge formation glycyltransferase FemA/FemB family protein [Methanoregula sp.]|nr:peptidoglycan bridge formation glycyltransferase FemA/FemB family protein [Methanoregula sp.]
MSIIQIEELHPKKEDEWDRLILKSISTNFLQSYCWSEIIKKAYKYETLFLEFTENEAALAYAPLNIQYPYIRNQTFFYRILNEINRIFSKQIISLGGPVILKRGNDLDIMHKYLQFIDSYSQKHHVGSIHISPFRYEPHYSNDTRILNIFEQFGYTRKIWGTYLVDLTQDEDKLWMSLEHSARKSLKQMDGRGVIVKKVSGPQEFIEKFIIPYNRMEKEFGRSEIPLWSAETIKNTENHDKYYHYFYAELGGNIEAVLGMPVYNGYATEIMSSTSKLAYENKIYAQDLLHWEMFRYAKSIGCHTFDLAGVNPHPSNAKEEGIRRFKKKWGGHYIEYSVFEKELPYISNTVRNFLIRSYRKLSQLTGIR